MKPKTNAFTTANIRLLRSRTAANAVAHGPRPVKRSSASGRSAMADANPMVLRYRPREHGARPVPMPAPPWLIYSAEPLRAAPTPAGPSASDIQRANLDLIAGAILAAGAPLSRAGIERVTGLNRSYIDQMLVTLENGGRVRQHRQGRLSFWGAP